MENKYFVEMFLMEMYQEELENSKLTDSLEKKKNSLDLVATKAYEKYKSDGVDIDEGEFLKILQRFYSKIESDIKKEEVEVNDKLYLMEKIKELDYAIYKEKRKKPKFLNKYVNLLLVSNFIILFIFAGYICMKANLNRDKAISEKSIVKNGEYYFLKGKEVHKLKKYKEAYEMYKISSEKGYNQSDYILGFFYYEGKYVDKNYKNALFYWKKALDNGVKEAGYNLAMMYLKGYGVEVNKEKSEYYLKIAADSGYVEAYFSLGNIFYGKKEYKEAARYWEKAYIKGDNKSGKSLANLYLYGIGIDKNIEKAKKILEEIEKRKI